ncbi:hypothetical protein NU10_04605 [Flavobacterium dauae]|uniref:hypothetical protein n=1 Tax=Flavobacterium dauae TaxID=1563479 RepID=UPI00101B4EEB|nr:hypothetical protein [Flavobacterium dauae]WLD24672.1 hypothetical protein NU10_04605 [Flavobacterium dauae]
MKKYLLFILIFLVNYFGYAQFNDCKEYGFNGKLKKVTTYNYSDLKKENKKWQVENDKLISKWEFTVNEDQNFTEIKITLFDKDCISMIYTSTYEFSNGKKSSYKRTDINEKVVETGHYRWLNEFTYTINSDFFEDYNIESMYILNNNYRDFINESSMYSFENGEKILMYKEGYENFFDENGYIQKSQTYDIEFGTSKLFNEIHEIDNFGNITEYAIKKENGELEKFVIRTFEYLNN